MSITIEKAILHALDPSSGTPVLSAETMAMDEGIGEFLETHFEKTLESDDVQTSVLREDHGFGQRMRDLAASLGVGVKGYDDAASGLAPWDEGYGADSGSVSSSAGGDTVFVEESRHLAEQLYQIISGNEAVPAGDLICLVASTGSSSGSFSKTG